MTISSRLSLHFFFTVIRSLKTITPQGHEDLPNKVQPMFAKIILEIAFKRCNEVFYHTLVGNFGLKFLT